MKTTRQLAAFAAAAAIAAGCNTEKAMPETDMNGVPVRFDMTVGGMPVSKTMTDDGTDGSRAVTWRDGDAVGIFAGDEAVVHQYVYDVQGDGVWKEASAEDAIYAAAGQVYDFSAYYATENHYYVILKDMFGVYIYNLSSLIKKQQHSLDELKKLVGV